MWAWPEEDDDLPTEPCGECRGTGRVPVRRYFRKTSANGRVGKLHAAVSPPWRDAPWYCGCGAPAQVPRWNTIEWLAEAGDADRCHYLRRMEANGARLP